MDSSIARPGRASPWRWRALVGGLVVALVVLSALAGAAGAYGNERLAMLLVAGLALPFGLYLLSRQFALAVLTIAPAALAVPLSIPTGTSTRLPLVWALVLGLCGFWFTSMALRERFRLVPTRANRPLLAMSAVCGVSLIWGLIWRDPGLYDQGGFILIQATSLITMLISFGAALLVGNFATTERSLILIVGCFLVCGALMTATQLLHIAQPILADRGLWGMWTATTAYGLLISAPRLRWHWRLLLAVLVAANLYLTVVVNSLWLSGWVPSLVAIAVATLLRSFKLFLAFLAVGVVVAYLSLGFLNSVVEDNEHEGALERIAIAEQSWRVISQHWLLGTGPAGYAIYYVTYYRDSARSTHNNYLDILAQFGLIGMAVWLWLAGSIAYEGYRLVGRTPPGALHSMALIATAGWIGGQFSMFLGDWILPFAYNQGNSGYRYTVYSWIFAGVIIGIGQVAEAHERRQAAVGLA